MWAKPKISKWYLSAIVFAAIAACTVNPVKEAQTLEGKADAIYGEYTSGEARMADFVQNEAVPMSIKLDLKKLHDLANPIAEKIYVARTNIEALKVSKPADLPAAIAALDELLKPESVQPITDFKTKVDKEVPR